MNTIKELTQQEKYNTMLKRKNREIKSLKEQLELLVNDDEKYQEIIIKQSKEIERLNNIINEIKDNCNDKTKDEIYLKMSKEALVNIINQKRNCIGYLRIERDKCFNIINELEKIFEEDYKNNQDTTDYPCVYLDKLKELKENK